MAEIRRLPGVSWFSSVFSLPTLTRPSYSRARVSIVGASIRQGPHHGAQKSMTTGIDESKTSDFQLSSVNSFTPSAIVRLIEERKSRKGQNLMHLGGTVSAEYGGIIR